MSRSSSQPGERALVWVASALKDLKRFPAKVQREIGYALSAAQFGGKHEKAKPWMGDGAGVLEIVEDYDGDTYRAVYTLRFEHAMYVVHAFQKKSPKAVKTSQPDKDLVKKRLKDVRDLYEQNYGKSENQIHQ